MKRFLKVIGLVLLLLIVVIISGVGWIVGTEKGFEQALALGKRFAPGTLAWDSAEGKLIGPLAVQGLRYTQDGGLEAQVKALNFDWTPSALTTRALVVNRLAVDGVDIILPEASDAPEEVPAEQAFELPNIALPLSIRLDDISVSAVTVSPSGQETLIEIDRVAFSGEFKESNLLLKNVEVASPQGQIRLAGSVTTRDAYPMDVSLDWQADVGQAKPVLGQGSITGTLEDLMLAHQLSGLANADIQAQVSNVLQNPAWDATIEANLPDADSLADGLTGTPSVRLQSSGTLDGFAARASVTAETRQTGPVTLDADIDGSLQQISINSILARLPASGGELSASGELAIESLEAELKGQWQGLSWPLQTDAQYSSDTGTFAFAGSAEAFTASAGAAVDGELIPAGQWELSAKGSSTALESFTILGQTLDGTIAAKGTAGWQDQPEWDVNLVTEGVNPGLHWAQFPGSINLELSSQGQVTEDGAQLTADIARLAGSLRQQALSGSGQVVVAGSAINIEDLNMTHGATRLQARGQVDEQMALEFNLTSPDLRTLMPDLQGAIALAGTVSGTQQAPAIKASGKADDVEFAGNRVGQLDLSIDGGLGADVVSSLSLTAAGIVAGGQQIRDIELSAGGTPGDHEVDMSADSSQGRVTLALEGGYANDTWAGSLSTLQLEDTLVGDWGLREAAAIMANAQTANVDELCLDNSNDLGALCLNGRWLAAGESVARLAISNLSPGLAEAFLPVGVDFRTQLDGDIDAMIDASGDLRAAAALALAPGSVNVDAGEEPVQIALERTTIDARLENNNATMVVEGGLSEYGDIDVQASIDDLSGEGVLSGRVGLNFDDLTLISAFAPQVQQVKGRLGSDLRLSGTVQAPIIEGQLALRDFGAEIPETAMLIADTQLTVTGSRDGTLLIDGQSSSGGGDLAINGNVNPATKALALTIKGDSYQVANTALMQAVVSPDMSITMNGSGMQVNGSVTIPSAYINANGGNEGIKTVSGSSDVVYVTDDEEEVEEAESVANNLTLDVQVVLGDSVEVEAGDFRGRLAGDLRVQQTPGAVPRGTGTINVTNGDYVIYGQELNMQRGRVLFSGGPVDNPTLDMEVAREVPEYDVVAGARVRGTAQSPRLELYSEPAMPDANILSFILIGQPPGTVGGSYTLGRYLTPDLYVSYGIGLFDAINTFNIRYRLTDRLAVEEESGTGSSADIIYTIER